METIQDALGYGVWVGLLLLICMGFYVGTKYGKEDKRWWGLAAAFFAMAILIVIFQFFGT